MHGSDFGGQTGGSQLPVNQYIVNLNAIQRNVQIIRNLAGTVPVWAVLKGDGYGLGLLAMARLLYAEGICRFCISDAAEARALRSAGLEDCKLLMLQPTQDPKILKELLQLEVICTASSLADAEILNQLAAQAHRIAQVHLKIDTGMGRYGFRPEELTDLLSVYRLGQIAVCGVYTHFACSFSMRKTQKQAAQFQKVIQAIRQADRDPGACHCCNSVAFLRYPALAMDGVRIGSAWLGRTPEAQRFGLKPVSFCRSRVEELHLVKKGQTSGYGGAWRAPRDSHLALLSVGWYHGFGVEYNRDTVRFRDCVRGCLGWTRAWLSGRRLCVQINGCLCPVRGHVGMLYTAVDVSKISCHVGDEAILDISPLLQKGLPVVYRYTGGKND